MRPCTCNELKRMTCLNISDIIWVNEIQELWGYFWNTPITGVGNLRWKIIHFPYPYTVKILRLYRAGLVLTRTLTRPCSSPDFFLASKVLFLTWAIAYQLIGTNFSLSLQRHQKWALLILRNYQQYLNIISFSHLK